LKGPYDKGFPFADPRPVIGIDYQQCDPSASKILLVSNALIRGNHQIEPVLLGQSEEIAVGYFCPPAFVRRFHPVPDQPVAQRSRCVVVEQNPHADASGWNWVAQALRRVLQHCVYLFARHPWEPVKELIHRCATFQVREESRYRYASAAEQPYAA
jgi:hypothetical protein